jgi:hypothetical protein
MSFQSKFSSSKSSDEEKNKKKSKSKKVGDHSKTADKIATEIELRPKVHNISS